MIPLDLDVDIAKRGDGNRAHSIGVDMVVIVLFNANISARNTCNPSNMTRPSIRLSNAPGHRTAINGNASRSRRLIPRTRIAPVVALILIGEMETKPAVDPPCDEAGTLALIIFPWINPATTTFVRIVVCDRAWETTAGRAFASHVASRASLDIVVGHIAAVRGFIHRESPLTSVPGAWQVIFTSVPWE